MKKERHYIFNNGRLLLNNNGGTHDIPEKPLSSTSNPHLFGEHDNLLLYVSESCTDSENLPEGYEWIGLRETFNLLPHPIYIEAGKASEILYFDTHHHYCGICGAPMEWHTAISKRCTQCGDEIWPQLNTAIIVLVHKGEKALLVKARNFKRDYYGLVAGFVETGESLEECVRREVYEETGLAIDNIHYFGSQPWPYPMGLMIGFHADYVSGNIALIDGELKDANFFDRDNLPPIPGKMSMARMLIDSWVKGSEFRS